MYAKIFAQIYDSSIAENYQVRHVFMDLLVLADRDGVLDMTPQAIARRTNIPMKVLMSALSALEQPDDQSRSPEGDGRRITRLDPHRDWGWQIVNFKAYHNIRDEDARRENNRRYQAEHRARLKATSKDLSAPVSTRKRPSAHTDVDVDSKKKASPSVPNVTKQRTAPSTKRSHDPLSWNPASSWQGITAADRAGWAQAYPACDIKRQLAAMHEWLKANPEKSRKRRWRRFVTNWLGRSQEKGGDLKGGQPTTRPDNRTIAERIREHDRKKAAEQEAAEAAPPPAETEDIIE